MRVLLLCRRKDSNLTTDVARLWAFTHIDLFVLHDVALIEITISIFTDSGVMDEHICPTPLRFNKTKSLEAVKPLDNTSFS